MCTIPQVIVDAVCTTMNVDPALVFSARRVSEAVYARALLVLILRQHFGWPSSRIGRALGRHRATVDNASETAHDLLVIDPVFRRHYARLSEEAEKWRITVG